MTVKTEIFEQAWLVWVKTPHGVVSPQIWYEPFVGCGELEVVGPKHKLPKGADSYLTLETLAELYPLEQRGAA